MAVALLVSYNEYKIKNIHMKHNARNNNNRINTGSFFATASVMLNYGIIVEMKNVVELEKKKRKGTILQQYSH